MDYLSRKFVVTLLFGTAIPILFKYLQISDSVLLASMAMGASYLAANIVDSKLNGGP
jgi:hypothetical protein